MKGQVKFFNREKGYGFITVGDIDYFVHITDVEDEESLEEDQLVEFEAVDTEKGPKALNVVPQEE